MCSKLYKTHRYFSINTKGQDFFVGDIHGNYSLLKQTLNKTGFNPENGDRLFSVGDLINHGEDSKACLELLLEPWFFAVTGNHEDLFLSLKEQPELVTSMYEVRGDWIKEYFDSPSELRFLFALVYTKMSVAFTIDTKWGGIGLTHAQAPDDWSKIQKDLLPSKEVFELFWSNEKFTRPINLLSDIKHINITVHGHANNTKVIRKKNQIWIDTLRATGRLTVISAEMLFSLTEVLNEY